jgi:hypothetical protein
MILPMACYTKHECYFGQCPTSRIFFKKITVLEVGSVSAIRCKGEKSPTQLGPVETSSLHRWTLSRSKKTSLVKD